MLEASISVDGGSDEIDVDWVLLNKFPQIWPFTVIPETQRRALGSKAFTAMFACTNLAPCPAAEIHSVI